MLLWHTFQSPFRFLVTPLLKGFPDPFCSLQRWWNEFVCFSHFRLSRNCLTCWAFLQVTIKAKKIQNWLKLSELKRSLYLALVLMDSRLGLLWSGSYGVFSFIIRYFRSHYIKRFNCMVVLPPNNCKAILWFVTALLVHRNVTRTFHSLKVLMQRNFRISFFALI